MSIISGRSDRLSTEFASTDEVDLSIVIPVYQSASTLQRLFEQLMGELDQLQLNYQLVFVEDGSPDNSWDLLKDLQRQAPDRVVAIQLMKNFGQQNAIMCGLHHADGRLIVTMDDDLQNPPSEIHKLIEAIAEQRADLVYGQYVSKKHVVFRNIGSAMVNGFYRLVFPSKVTVTSFRIMRRELAKSILGYTLNYTFIDGLLAWNTDRIGGVDVEHHSRMVGRSGYSLKKLVVLALNLFTNFSLLPLQFVSALGFVFALGGLLGGAFYFVMYLVGQISVPGYASIIVALSIFAGIQLLALGMIGEYVGRLHLNVNQKPQFVQRQVLSPCEKLCE
ncbi:MAG: glycosyltransferase family 2 protein [Pirellulaceae bacterium]|nr:glycosyltransferase family 2 protein [Pirellulaceae bacterium]